MREVEQTSRLEMCVLLRTTNTCVTLVLGLVQQPPSLSLLSSRSFHTGNIIFAVLA
jgi:hypothetical protein